jgi:Domain of unknown function (DUF397)
MSTERRSETTSPGLAHARWRKSIRSNNSVACVEVAQLGDDRAVRDSKDPDGPWLCFTRREWESFITMARADRLDVS